MAKKQQQPQTIIQYTDQEIEDIITGLFTFLREKPDNIFVDDYFILEKQMFASDVEILKETNPKFKEAFYNGMKIEAAKLKKFAAADRLNATFVKNIIDRHHNY